MGQAEITVVVCSHNGAETLPGTLAALGRQTVGEALEIIVVDDGSSDDTAAVAERPGVTVLRHPANKGLAAARNTGWRAASAPIVAFTDDDCRPREDWAERLLAAFAAHPDAPGVGGSLTVRGVDSFVTRYLRRNNPLEPLEMTLVETPGLLGRLWLYLGRCAGEARATGVRPVSSLVGGNMAFRVSALRRVDGLDERFRFGSEEEDLCRRLLHSAPRPQEPGGSAARGESAARGKAGESGEGDGHGPALWYDPSAVVDHYFEPDLADTLRRSRGYGRGNGRMFLKHRDQNPVVYPLPFAVLGLVALAVVRRSAVPAVLAAALPPLLFSRWVRAAARERQVDVLGYPYVQLAQETWGNLGMVETLVRERADFPREVASP